MAKTWVLLAHGSAAEILEVQKNGEEINLIKEFSHPKTAKKDTDIHADRPGRSYASSGSIRHTMSPEEDPIDHERRVFAKELADFLTKAFGENKFGKLILVANPDVLGNLRDSLSDPVKKVITGELNKNLLSSDSPKSKLIEKIREDLNLASI